MEGRFFFHSLHEEYGGIFFHLLHKKLKVWWKKSLKKLNEHARLLGSSEYVDMQMHAIMQILGSMYICKRF